MQKIFLETLSYFSQSEFPEKGRFLLKLGRSSDVTGRVNIISSLFSLKAQAEKTDSGVPKTFTRISLCI